MGLTINSKSILRTIWKVKAFSLTLTMLTLSSCSGQKSNKIQSDILNNETVDINFDKGIYRGMLDSKGYLWFTSRGEGVYRFDGESFINFSKNEGLCDNDISSIFEDNDGSIWFGTTNGLCRYDRRIFTHVPIPYSDTTSLWLDKVYPIVNPNQVMSIIQDQIGNLWIGTNGAGVYKYDGENFTQYLSKVGMIYEDSLYHNVVLSITEDLSGNLWFTSLSHAGLSRYDGKSFTHFKIEEGLSDNFLRTAYCDKDGNIWVGTHGNRNGGLDFYDGKSFVNFNKMNGLCSNNVHSIYQDNNGHIWLGSDRGNLCIYDGKTFKEFTNNQGAKFAHIECILGDAENNIWFGGRNGLWKFDGESVFDMTKQK